MKPIVTCSACGKEGRHAGRGWCQACYTRWRAHGKPESGPPPSKREPVKCGTRQGWDRHMYRNEKACGPCRKAHADNVRQWSHTSPRLGRRMEPCTEWTEQQASAAGKVAELAVDAEDCRYLLDALGLLPEGVRPSEQVGGAA